MRVSSFKRSPPNLNNILRSFQFTKYCKKTELFFLTNVENNIKWDKNSQNGNFELETELDNFMVVKDNETKSEVWITVKEYL